MSTTSTDPISQAKDKIRSLLDTQCDIPIKTTTPIHFYVKSLNDLLEEAEYLYQQQALEQSFILFSRYSTSVHLRETHLLRLRIRSISILDFSSKDSKLIPNIAICSFMKANE